MDTPNKKFNNGKTKKSRRWEEEKNLRPMNISEISLALI
jgi:hypothetical protein